MTVYISIYPDIVMNNRISSLTAIAEYGKIRSPNQLTQVDSPTKAAPRGYPRHGSCIGMEMEAKWPTRLG